MQYSNSPSQKTWKMIYSWGFVCLFEDVKILAEYYIFCHFRSLIISKRGSIPRVSLLNLLGSYPDHQFQSLFVMEMDDASGYFGLKIELFTKNSNFWHFQLLIIQKLGSIPPVSLQNLLDSPSDYQILLTTATQLGGAARKFQKKIDFTIKNAFARSKRRKEVREKILPEK